MRLADQKWIKAIPFQQGNHGSGILQKKLWTLVSSFVRIRDFYDYGTYVDNGEPIKHWRASDAGHFIAYSVCRGMYKFCENNIHAQSPRSNSWGSMEVGHAYAEELGNRGYLIENLRAENRDTPLKVNDTLVVEKMRDILQKMDALPEKPDYYDRVTSLLHEAQ